ncbi:MAG: glycosyltransferase [Candidatus Berkelbacteria bacterium]
MPPKNKKNLEEVGVFVGFNGAGAAGIYSYTRILKSRNIKLDFYGIGQTYFNQPVDILLKFPKNPVKSLWSRLKLFFELLPKYKIWHFNYSQTLFFYPLNLLLLKLFGKKIVVTFRGSDCETELDFTKTNPIILAHRDQWPSYFKNFHHLTWQAKIAKKIRTAFLSDWSDTAVINGPYLASSVPNYDLIIPYARDLGKINQFKIQNKKINKKLVILHVPSDPEVKGTVYIEKAFKELADKYPDCEFKILDFMPYDQLLGEMAKADIVVDQLLVGWYGGQAVEAMALGSAVISFVEPSYLENIPFGKTLPIANTNVFTFKEDLEVLINSPEKIQKLMNEGPAFAAKYHDSTRIADAYQKVYEEVLK